MLSINRWLLLPLSLSLLLLFELKDINIKPIIPFGAVWQLLIILFLSLLAVTSNRKKLSKNSVLFLVLISSFFIWSLGVSLKSGEPYLSLQRILLLVFSTYPLLISILCADNVERLIVSYLKLMVMIIFIISSLALIVNMFGDLKVGDNYSFKSLALGPIRLEQAVMGSFLRAGGYFGNPNIISRWLVFFFPFVFMLYHAKEISKLQLIVVLIVFALMLLTALSRSGMTLAVIAAFIYNYLYSTSIKKKFFLIVIAVATSFALLTIYLHYFGDSLRGSLDLNSRDEIWSVLFQSIINNPLTGIGFGVSRELVLDLHNIDFAAHNFYIEKFAEVGFIGLLLAVLPFIFVALLSYTKIKRSKTNFERSFFAAVTAFYISFFLYLNVEAGLFVFSIWHIFIVIISALTLNLIKNISKNVNSSPHNHRP